MNTSNFNWYYSVFFLIVDLAEWKQTHKHVNLVKPTSLSFFCSSSSSCFLLLYLFGYWMKMSVRAAAPLNGTVPAGNTPPSSSPPVKRGGLTNHTLPLNVSQNKTSTNHLLSLRRKFWSQLKVGYLWRTMPPCWLSPNHHQPHFPPNFSLLKIFSLINYHNLELTGSTPTRLYFWIGNPHIWTSHAKTKRKHPRSSQKSKNSNVF